MEEKSVRGSKKYKYCSFSVTLHNLSPLENSFDLLTNTEFKITKKAEEKRNNGKMNSAAYLITHLCINKLFYALFIRIIGKFYCQILHE